MLGIIIAKSKSKPMFSRHAVTGNGEALAICAAWAVGFNENCDGTGIVFQPSSVVTSPSAGDIVGPLIKWGMKKLVGVFLDVLVPKSVPEPFRSVAKEMLKPIVKIATDPLIDLVDDHLQPTIDDHVVPALESLVDGL